MSFPNVRLQRLRRTPALRDMVAEVSLQKRDFIMPVFVNESLKEKNEIKSLPGIFQHTLESVIGEVESIVQAGVHSILLFGTPSQKDARASEAYDPDGITQKAIRLIKKQFPHLVVIADCCFCAFTSDGHCNVGTNDETLTLLGKTAVTYAQAGADIIAPSGMMDGMVQAIRLCLDDKKYPLIPIMSYAVKYASHFYGPFRDAAGSTDSFHGDRKHHQIAPSQAREGMREAALDVAEGADFLIVKPALAYQDMIYRLHQAHDVPIVAYNVSGEHAMLMGSGNPEAVYREVFLGFKRAGADLIISYYAKDMAQRV